MITKIPEDDYIDYTKESIELCNVCKSLNIIPCDHKIRSFRQPDRMDSLIKAVNEIIEHINKNEASSQ